MLDADRDARVGALLLAIAPGALRGAVVRGRSREQCEGWIQASASLLPPGAPVRRVPVSITEDRLLGGLDFTATLRTGRPVVTEGVLALARGGYLLLTASGLQRSTWMHVASAIDKSDSRVPTKPAARQRVGFAAIAMETPDDDPVPAAFSDRVALMLDLSETSRTVWMEPLAAATAAAARRRFDGVETPAELIAALCGGASRLGVTSTRVMVLAVAAMRASAALHGRSRTDAADLACAARLVIAHRATESGDTSTQPADEASPPQESSSPNAERAPNEDRDFEPGQSGETGDANQPSPSPDELTAIVVRASRSALPAGLLVASAARSASVKSGPGRSGAEQMSGTRGRQIGTRRGDPRRGARLDIVATLRAAVPMQRLRRAERPERSRLIELRRDDLRLRRCITPTSTTTLFVVDASGSAALNRLAEVKGAVELMLAEGYARRNRVALISFRGAQAEQVLAPTHALARARRAIAGMPAGGGTPLASALDLAAALMPLYRRDASEVVTVVLSDGRANVARNGTGGRAGGEADALDAARRASALHGNVVWVDSADRPAPFARRLADALGARYLPLPRPNAGGLTAAAMSAAGEAGR